MGGPAASLVQLRCGTCGSIEWRQGNTSVIAETTRRGKERLGVFRWPRAELTVWVCACGATPAHAEQTAALDALVWGEAPPD